MHADKTFVFIRVHPCASVAEEFFSQLLRLSQWFLWQNRIFVTFHLLTTLYIANATRTGPPADLKYISLAGGLER
jgi:hypothetical protein